MIWSFSSYRQFTKCQRQWFFKNILASSRANDPLRKEAFYLSQLKSISAWRGAVVDKTISDSAVNRIRRKESLTLDDLLSHARHLCRRQFDFAKARKYRNGQAKGVSGDDFCALFAFEYGNPVSNEELKDAWAEIETSLSNFLNNARLISMLKSSKMLVTQRALTFQVNGVTVRGVPDLILFFESEPPHIFDWKVHAFGSKAYDIQLLVYAVALARSKPHKDFPAPFHAYPPEAIRISEYQLLLNVVRDYSVTQERVMELEELMAESILEMDLSGALDRGGNLKMGDFETTRFPENCQTCGFKRICWEEN